MVAKSQLYFTLRTLPTHVRWYSHYQESLNHLEYLTDLYERLKEGPRTLLDEFAEFQEIYVYGCGSSDEDGESSTLSTSDIKARLSHLKDKANATNVSLRGKTPLAKEIGQLKSAKAKIEAKLTHFTTQAKEAYINL